MPRTKVSKNSKRNREAANREEMVRNIEMRLETCLDKIDQEGKDMISEINQEVQMMKSRLKSNLLHMKLSDFLQLNLNMFCDWVPLDTTTPESVSVHDLTTQSSVSSVSTLQPATRITSETRTTNDEEDSSASTRGSSNATNNALYLGMSHLRLPGSASTGQTGRTPGPLLSARARRTRRSRSACSDLSELVPKVPGSAMKSKSGMNAAEHGSRSRLRTPIASRVKALSADRMDHQRGASSPQTPPVALLRWPKPGEIALSKFGTPIVAQVMPDKYANVNIPVKNGMLSLRPKKLSELQTDIIDAIDTDTLSQIKTLNENLNFIMNMAEKAGLK